MFNTYIYVAIGVLCALLAGAGYFGYSQTIKLGEAYATIEQKDLKIAEKEAVITNLTIEVTKNVEKVQRYQADVRRIESEKAQIQSKAIKDLNRVEKIAKSKSKIYERLVNIDYQKTQRELKELTQ